MNCQEISQLIQDAKAISEQFKQLDPVELRNNLDKYKSLRNEFEKLLLLVENIEPNKYHIRERIAKKFGVDFADSASGGIFYTEKRVSDDGDVEYFLINNEGNKIIGGPYLDFNDSGKGKYLVYKGNSLENGIVEKYQLIDKDGKMVNNFESENGVTMPSIEFKDEQPLSIYYLGQGGKWLKRNYLTPDGETIIERYGTGPTTRFSEGLIWELDENNEYTLYNDKGEALCRCNDPSIENIDIVINGIAIGTRNDLDNNPKEVCTIDSKGQVKTIRHIAKNASFKRYGDVIYSLVENQGEYYFTLDGRVLAVPASRSNDLVNPKEKLIKVEISRNEYRFVDYDNRPINSDIFMEAGRFYDGLAPVQTKNGEWHFMNKEGQLNTLVTKNIRVLSALKDNRAMALDKEGWFLVNSAGEDLFNGKRYEYVDIDSRSGVHLAQEAGDKNVYVKPNGERIF